MTEHRLVTIEQIDRYRAGLLDDDPATRQRVEASLRADAGLAAEYARWDEARRELDATTQSDTALNNRLRLIRRRVLNGETRSRWHISISQTVLATAASVALTLGISLWLYQDTSPDRAPATLARAAVTEQDVPDLTENVEFYGWLENQDDLVDL